MSVEWVPTAIRIDLGWHLSRGVHLFGQLIAGVIILANFVEKCVSLASG